MTTTTYLHVPVPGGGAAGNVVKMGTSGFDITDGPFVVVTGTSATAVNPLIQSAGNTTGPTTVSSVGFARFGVDSSGNTLYVAVWK